jgi:hypothetical protein
VGQAVSEDNLKQTVTLLAIFSLQLSSLVNQLALTESEEGPPIITKAKKFL